MVLLNDAGVTIDWSLRLGDLVSFAGFAIGGIGVIFAMKSDIRTLGMKLGFLESTVKSETEAQNKKIDDQSKEIERFGELLSLMGRHEERFISFQRQLDDLKHGKGFIVDKGK